MPFESRASTIFKPWSIFEVEVVEPLPPLPEVHFWGARRGSAGCPCLLNHLYVRTQRRRLFLLAPFLRSLLPSSHPIPCLLLPSISWLFRCSTVLMGRRSCRNVISVGPMPTTRSTPSVCSPLSSDGASLYDFWMLDRKTTDLC